MSNNALSAWLNKYSPKTANGNLGSGLPVSAPSASNGTTASLSGSASSNQALQNWLNKYNVPAVTQPTAPAVTAPPVDVAGGAGAVSYRPLETIKLELDAAQKAEKSAKGKIDDYMLTYSGFLDMRDPAELQGLKDAATAATGEREKLEAEYYAHPDSYQDKYGDIGDVGKAFATVISKPFLAADVAVETAKAAANGGKVDTNSLASQKYKDLNEVREDSLSETSGFGRTLANTGMSIADNLYSRFLGLGSNFATGLIMGATSAADKMHELNQQGEDAGRSLVRGVISGGIEGATEALPIGTLANMIKTGGKGIVKNLLKQSGVEATEEGISYVANYIADKAFKDPNAKFDWNELKESVVSGGLSGLFFGLGGTVIGRSNVKDSGNTPNRPTAGAIPGSGLDGTPSAQDGILPVQDRVTTQNTPSGIVPTQTLLGVDTSGQIGAVEGEKTAAVTIPTAETGNSDLRTSAVRYGVDEDTTAQAERLSNLLGRKIVFDPDLKGANGKYDRLTKTITINPNSSNPVAQIISHELTHSVEFADAYNELSALVQLRMARSGVDLEQKMQAKKDQYAAWGEQLDNRGAMQEVVAEYISENLLTDEAAITEMAQNHPTIVQKILNFFDSLLASLQGRVGASGTKSQERAEIRKMRDIYWRALQQAQAGYGVSTETTMERMSDAYTAGELSEADYDDAVDVVMEEESTAGKSMLEGDPLDRRSSGDGVQYSISESFASEVDDWINNTEVRDRVVDGGHFRVGTTSEPLKSIGVREGNVYWRKSKIGYIMAEHPEISANTIKAVPEILEQPILVMKSQTRDDSIVLFGNVNAENGKPVMAALALTPRPAGGMEAEFSLITSAYGRSNQNIKNLIENSELLYIDKNRNRANTWLMSLGVQFPSDQSVYGSIGSIAYTDNGVKIQGKKLSELSKIDRMHGVLPSGQYSFTGTPESGALPVDEGYWNSIMEQGRIPFNETQQPGYAEALLAAVDEQNPYAGRGRDVDPSEYMLLDADTVQQAKTEEPSAEIDNLPTKAANALKRAENAMAHTMEERLHLTRADHLPEIVRTISEEYLRTGDVSQETADSLLAQLWNEGTSSEDTTDPFFEECAKAEFSDALAKMRLELRKVKRFALDRAEQLARAETTELTLAEVTALYPKLKDARRKYERAQAKNLLTSGDAAMVNRILRGDAEFESLDPAEYNVEGIRAVYEAKQEYESYAKQIRKWNQSRKAGLRNKADTFLRTANAWRDKAKGILYSRETMERNVRDIVPDNQLADQVVHEYFTPVHDAVAAATRTKNAYRDRVRALNLSTKIAKADAADGKVSEAHAVQLLGEAQDSIRMLERSRGRMKERDGKTLQDWKAVVENLWHNNPQLNQAKIEGAVEEFRKIYDELFTQMNEARVRNGYEPINYRSGYFPHFQPGDGDGVLVQFGKALGIDTAVCALPTNINGLSHTFKPGITWMGNAQERLGFNTVYDAVEGFDKYIEGCADVIHLTDSIQNLRAFASQIRYRTTEQGIRDQVDTIRGDERLTAQEKEDMIQNLYNDPKTKYVLGNFVVELDEYINLLANKKSRADRNMEQALGRDAYNVVKGLESRVAANMVAVNPASWLTNFIPITQGWAGVTSKHMLQGMQDTLKAVKADDGIVGQSSFLTNRRGSDPLVQTWAQKASETASKPMSWIDNFTAGSLVRARYYQNVERGMSEVAAMEEADGWVAGVMADRSKGSTPTLFNRSNPITKLFTQFQLEVNNQLGYVFKDIPRDMKDKGVAALAWALLKFALGAFLFDEVYEYFIGRRPALDPIGILNDTAGDLTGYKLPNLIEGTVRTVQGGEFFEKGERTSAVNAGRNLVKNVAGELPFTSVLSMAGVELDQGRIPVSSALPDFDALGDALGNTEWSAKKRMKEGLEELAKPALYLGMPFGGGQLKKFGQGIYATAKGGSYTLDNEGNEKLQYPVYNDNAWEITKSLVGSSLFGKTSLPTGQDWVEDGFPTLSVKETLAYQNMTDAGISGKDAWEWLQLIKQADGTLGKLTAISESGVDEAAAKELMGVVMGTKLETEKGEPTQYAKMLDAMETSLGVQETINLKTSGADLDRFLEYADAGLNAESAYDLSLAAVEMRKDEDIDGAFTISENARLIEAMGLTKEQQEVAWLVMYPEWASKANEKDVSTSEYIAYKKATYGLTKKADKLASLRAAGFSAVEAARLYKKLG